ncbi:MAG: hypothetical protein KDE31_15635 [Caldilineaceae bacterium]|nr:hypothetical protein [Caldilineaceae bacterium]
MRKKWLLLNGLLWPLGFFLYALLVAMLIDGAGRYGLYAICPQWIELHIATSPLLTFNPCLQGWFALHFCWVGMIVGTAVGYGQWRFALRDIGIPDTWLTLNTISWAVGGPLAYLSYRLFLQGLTFQLASVWLQARPELIIFTWTILLSEVLSGFGRQCLLRNSLPKPRHRQV